MNNQELKKYMFPKRGDMKALADKLGILKQDVNGWFRGKKVTEANLRTYAKAMNINEEEFLKTAAGPVPKEIKSSSDGLVNEDMGLYGKQPGTKQHDEMYHLVLGLIENQKDQNEAMMKLANAAEINAQTIARLTGKQ